MQPAYAQHDYPMQESPASGASEQQLLLRYAPLVKRVVRQLMSQASHAMDRDDMQQIGLVGLLHALRRYGEPDERFESYAMLRVRGAVLDELRRQDWRPRTVRQESHRTRDAVRELMRRLGREPTAAEVQQDLGISAEEYQQHQLAENAEQLANFDELLHKGEGAGGISPEGDMVLQHSIEQALGFLDEREQRVVQLYYQFDLSLKEIAAVLGLTEARVCQINKGALKKLKELIQ
jgi:RNA polymerase sigma factor FliA